MIKTDSRPGVEYEFYIDDLPDQTLLAISDHINKVTRANEPKEARQSVPTAKQREKINPDVQ